MINPNKFQSGVARAYAIQEESKGSLLPDDPIEAEHAFFVETEIIS